MIVSEADINLINGDFLQQVKTTEYEAKMTFQCHTIPHRMANSEKVAYTKNNISEYTAQLICYMIFLNISKLNRIQSHPIIQCH